jgi:hypothetical protein
MREQLRAIPLDTLHAFALAELERSSLRAVAERAGVGRTTLHGFLYRGRKPHPRVRRLLALWYWSETGGVEVDRHACEALLSALPADRREAAVAELQAFVLELHRTYGGDAG